MIILKWACWFSAAHGFPYVDFFVGTDSPVPHGPTSLSCQSEDSCPIKFASINETLVKRAPLPAHQPFPQSPWVVDFPNQNTVNAVVYAWADSWKLVAAAKTALENVIFNTQHNRETTMFIRYFQPDQLDKVRSLFDKAMPPNRCGASISSLKVRWEVGRTGRLCSALPGLLAELEASVDANGVIVYNDLLICRTALVEAGRPPSISSSLEQDCAEIGDTATLSMLSPGAILLHEMVHWMSMIGTGRSDWVMDWNAMGSRGFSAVVLPPTGYGPYNSMQVNRLNQRGAWNADNFLWFGLEAFYGQMCQLVPPGGTEIQPRMFKDPLDNWADMAPIDDIVDG